MQSFYVRDSHFDLSMFGYWTILPFILYILQEKIYEVESVDNGKK